MKHSDSQLRWIERALGVDFSDIGLLERSLVHSSFVAEFPGVFEESNERLEFLGDSVLDLVVAEELTRRYPGHPEGALTQMRASLVDKSALARIGRRLGLGEWLVMGKGEAEIGGAERESNLANAFEALLGALFLDGGYEAAREFAQCVMRDELDVVADMKSPPRHPKSLLHEAAMEQVFRRRSMRRWSGRDPIMPRRSWRRRLSAGGQWAGARGAASRRRRRRLRGCAGSG